MHAGLAPLARVSSGGASVVLTGPLISSTVLPSEMHVQSSAGQIKVNGIDGWLNPCQRYQNVSLSACNDGDWPRHASNGRAARYEISNQ